MGDQIFGIPMYSPILRRPNESISVASTARIWITRNLKRTPERKEKLRAENASGREATGSSDGTNKVQNDIVKLVILVKWAKYQMMVQCF